SVYFTLYLHDVLPIFPSGGTCRRTSALTSTTSHARTRCARTVLALRQCLQTSLSPIHELGQHPSQAATSGLRRALWWRRGPAAADRKSTRLNSSHVKI